MYVATLSPDLAVIDALREVTPRLPDVAAQYFSQTVKPALEAKVAATVAVYPGPVVHPFEFATDKSRRWYFANKVRSGGKGGEYARTGDLGKAWIVQIDRRSKDSFITIRNTDPAAGFVYGSGSQRQVPGHAATGWGRDLDSQLDQLSTDATNLVLDGWTMLINKILQGEKV